MISITVTGIDDRIRALQTLQRELPRTQEEIVRRASIMVRDKLSDKMRDAGGRDPFFGRTGGIGNTLASRSGQSLARLTPGGRVLTSGDGSFAEVGSPDRHIAFLEEGGTISGHPYLRIPLASAQTAQGIDRYKGTPLRSIPGVFLQRTRAGRLFAMRKAGGARSSRVEMLYLLVRSVSLRGRHVFRDTRNELDQPIAQMAGRQIQLLIARANAA